MNILIAGAGNLGRHLAHMLVEAGHTVTLIDINETQTERARRESGARTIRGDATEPAVLEKADIRGADVVVAATGDDEDNIVVSNMAKFEFEAPRVVARVQNALNTWLYEPDIGVDVVVSAPHTIAQLIEEQVVIGSVAELATIPNTQGAILETTIPLESPVAGQSIGGLEWPSGCVPVALARGSKLLAVSPQDILQPDDRLLCVADPSQAEALHTFITGLPTSAER